MLRLIKKSEIIIMAVLIVSMMSAGNFVYAATDTYANYAELSANQVLGVDYKIQSSTSISSVAVIAIHGGGIEVGTTELAKAVSVLGNYNYYSFLGLLKFDNSILHITSANFDEKTGRDIVAKSKYTLSIHGASGTEKVTYLGGLDTALGKQIQNALTAAGFIVKPAKAGLEGTDKANIANSNISGMGVQLELSRGLRDSFLSKTGSSTLAKYSKAINSVLIKLN